MGVKLYDLTEMYQNAWDMVEDESTDLTLVEQALTAIEGAIEVKAGNIAIFIKSLDTDAKAIKDEEDRLLARRKAIENKRDGIKLYLQQEMEKVGIDKIKTSTHSIGIQNNPWSVEVVDEGQIPKDYFKIIPEQRVLDKVLLKKELTEGVEISGAILRRGRSVRIR